MMNSNHVAVGPKPASPGSILEQAIDNLLLGILIFDVKREVVFCNKRYMEIYGLSAEQVRPGTPVSQLIQHRLKLGLKIRSTPEDYIRERIASDVVGDTTTHEFTDGRIISYTLYPMADGGGMATHEDITAREEMSARLKAQYELGKQQEARLKLQNFQFDTAINNMSQGLCFFDADHRLMVCNDRYAEMYDLPRDRVGPGTP
jgi:PAS domain S-box-containing protein